MSSQVTLYVYDLSGGMAKSLSRAIIGQQIDGIYHTGIVVYNKVNGGVRLLSLRNSILEAASAMGQLARRLTGTRSIKFPLEPQKFPRTCLPSF